MDRFPEIIKQPAAREQRAECLFQIGNYTEAVKEYQILNSTNPTFDSLVRQGRCLKSVKRYSEASAVLSKAIELRPLSSQLLSARGDCFRRLENFPRAVKDFSDAMALSPQNFVYVYGRALCYLESKQNKDAVRDFTAALADKNLRCRAYIGRAKAYENLGEKQLAQKDRLAANLESKSVEADLFK